MAGEILQPGVEVIQTFRTLSPTFLRPTLAPIVVGAAYELVDVLDSDGAVNSDALYGTYSQVGETITQSSFPDPRSNIAELDVVEADIRPFMLFAGQLDELIMEPGEGFLTSHNKASRPAMKSDSFSSGLAIGAFKLILAIDQATRTNTTEDVTVTFPGASGANVTAAAAITAINAAVGATVATLVDTDKVQIASTQFGADASVTIRAGGSANELMILGWVGGAGVEERVVGSGFRGQDDSDSDNSTPWIDFFRGEYYQDGTAQGAGVSLRAGWYVADATSTFKTSIESAVTFGTGATIPIVVGDKFFADGVQVNGGEVMKVETSRFKVGTINATLSTVDATTGRFTTKVYDETEVNLVTAAVPWGPANAWFKATNLDDTLVTPTTASVTGTREGLGDEAAVVTGTGTPAGPFSIQGNTIDYVLTVDGVASAGTFTFTGGPYADMDAVVAAIDIDGVTASNSASDLRFTTDALGKDQAITIKSTGTANATLGFSASVDTSDVGEDDRFPARYTSAAITFGLTVTGTDFIITESTDGGATYAGTATTVLFATNPANIAALVTDLNAIPEFTAAYVARAGTAANTLDIFSKTVGSNIRFQITNGTTGGGALGTAPLLDGITTLDESDQSLNGSELQVIFNGGEKTWSVVFSDDSLDEAISLINTTVGGTVASAVAGTNTATLKLTSLLSGLGSSVDVEAVSPAAKSGHQIFTLSTTAVAGTGRPYPDAYLDSSNNLVIGSEILRNSVTGKPLDPVTNAGSLYIQYKALRKDLSALAEEAGVLKISDQTVLSTALNPISTDNPLGLGMFLAMLNAPNIEVKGFGLDEVTTASPYGSEQAWARAASFLQSEEVYAIAPLTQEEVVHQLWATHVDVMSDPEQGGERIVFVNAATPTRGVNQVAASGTDANDTGTDNQLLLDQSPVSGLAALGVNAALPLTYADGVFVEFQVSGTTRRYLVTNVSGALLTLSTTFLSTENTDSFFTTTDLTESVISASYSVKVRGSELLITGTALTDYSEMANQVADAANGYANRRVFYVFPGDVNTTVAGVDTVVEGFYACAAIAGMVAGQPPQQGFTNFPIAGLTAVPLTDGDDSRFTKSQLDTMAGGGVYILKQDVSGAPVSCRHQLSTKISSIEERELSITKAVDFVAKFLRLGVKNYIGTSIINDAFLDTLGATIGGMLAMLVELGVVSGATINNLVQDESQPDRLLVDVTLSVQYPANYIRITLVV